MAKKSLFIFRPGFLVSIALVLLGLVFICGLIGVEVAGGSPRYAAYLWVPGLLCAASAFLIAVILFRLARRAVSASHKP